MTSDQRSARIFGVLYLITFVTSIPALALFQPVLDDPAGYIAGAGQDNRNFLGVLLELFLIIANIGTAVVVFPILRRQNEILSLAYVTARIVCAQGLDVPARPRLHRRLGQWTDTCLPDVPIRARAAPEFLWELFLGIYCTVKGFRPSALAALDARRDRTESAPAVTPA
jgi:hypothetical protein